MLLNLTSGILKEELGVESFGHRQLLLEAIQNIQRSTVLIFFLILKSLLHLARVGLPSIGFVEKYRSLIDSHSQACRKGQGV